MSQHLERARLLLHQSRPAEAEREALQAVTQMPDHPEAHAMLALARIEQDRRAEALEAARAAIALAPDVGYFHYVHALILHRSNDEKNARTAINEAIRIDPEDADSFALLAGIELGLRDWSAALAAAESALQLNPEHVGANNLRAMALVRLGRKEEATQTVAFALDRAPEDAFSHANQGWNLLHRNNPKKAQEHFREALRLEPDLEYARNGMLEALKATNPVYRAMLAYFLWMGRQSERFQWLFIIGIFFGTKLVRSLYASSASEGTRALTLAVVVALYGFIYLTWTAVPMFNLLLRFNRFGRLVLNRDERLGSTLFGLAALPAFAALGWWLWTHDEIAILTTLIFAATSVCIAATFARSARPRAILGTLTAGLAALGLGGLALLHSNPEIAGAALLIFMFGFIGFQLLSNIVTNRS